MHLKTRVELRQMYRLAQYTLWAEGTPEGKSGRLGGWLEGEARRIATEKVANSQALTFGSCNWFARTLAGYSLQKRVAL